jgi:hypothetical protein
MPGSTTASVNDERYVVSIETILELKRGAYRLASTAMTVSGSRQVGDREM